MRNKIVFLCKPFVQLYKKHYGLIRKGKPLLFLKKGGKQYMFNGYSVNEKRCLECQENLVGLNNKVNTLIEHDMKHSQDISNLSNPDTLLSDKLFYEGNIFNAYSYIKQLFLSAKSSIPLIDGYVDLSVLDMLVGIPIPITVYLCGSSIK